MMTQTQEPSVITYGLPPAIVAMQKLVDQAYAHRAAIDKQMEVACNQPMNHSLSAYTIRRKTAQQKREWKHLEEQKALADAFYNEVQQAFQDVLKAVTEL